MLYKMDNELSWYARYVGMVGTVLQDCERVAMVSLDASGHQILPYTRNLMLAHGPCPMDAKTGEGHAQV